MNKKIKNAFTAVALSTVLAGLAPLVALAQNPVPEITSISPNAVISGSSAITLTVDGTDFIPGSAVYFNGNVRSTSYVSSTQLTANIPASDLDTPGSYSVMVTNPSPGGGNSNVVFFTVHSATSSPVITSISPSQVSVGGGNFTLVVHGNNFVASNLPSVVRINGSDRTTTFISSTQLQATILASDIATTGNKSITVHNAGPNNTGTSNAVSLTVQSTLAFPVVTGISPSSKVVGSSGFVLTVHGWNFNQDSIVRFNGLQRSTTYVSPTMLTAVILTSDLSVATTHAVYVTNPGTGNSNSVLFTVSALPGLPDTGVPGLPDTGIGPEDPMVPERSAKETIALIALLALPLLLLTMAMKRVKANA